MLDTNTDTRELLSRIRKEMAALKEDLAKAKRPKPAGKAINLAGDIVATWVWWSVLHGSVARWVAWSYFGLGAFCIAVYSIQILVLYCKEQDE